MAEEIRLKISKEQALRYSPYIIILISTVLGIILVAPLFKPGILVNIDNSFHYAREWCLLNSNIPVPNNWCGYLQAGYPSSSYYYPIVDGLIVLLAKFLGLELSYKLVLALAMFVPGFGAYLLLRKIGRPLAGAIAYAFLTLQPGSWHIGGFEESFLVGMWPQALTAGFFLVFAALFLDFYKKPDWKKLILVSISTTLLTHPFTLVLTAVTCVIYVAVNYKESLKNQRWLLYFAGLVLLINAYYWLPILQNINYFVQSVGPTMTWDLLYYYLLIKIPWYVYLFAVLGIVASVYFKDETVRDLRTFGSIVLVYFVLSFIPFIAGPWFIGIRAEIFVAFFIFIFAALFFEYLFKIKSKKQLLSVGSIAVVLLVIGLFFNSTLPETTSVLLLDRAPEMYDYLKSLPDGRVVVEDTLYGMGNNALSLTHLNNLVPLFTNKETIGINVYFPKTRDLWNLQRGDIFNRKISSFTKDELNNLFELYNIKYILSYSPEYDAVLANMSNSVKEFPPFKVYETNITTGYFVVDNGTIEFEEYNGTYGRVYANLSKSGYISMKVNPYANWKAYVDGKQSTMELCNGIICTKVHSGNSVVEFRYELGLVPYAGYALTFVGFVLCFVFYRRRE